MRTQRAKQRETKARPVSVEATTTARTGPQKAATAAGGHDVSPFTTAEEGVRWLRAAARKAKTPMVEQLLATGLLTRADLKLYEEIEFGRMLARCEPTAFKRALQRSTYSRELIRTYAKDLWAQYAPRGGRMS